MAQETLTARHRGPRGGECDCGACGVRFSSLTAFDAHQRVPGQRGRRTGDGPVVCQVPADVGLVPYERAGGTAWGAPGRAEEDV